MRRLAALLIVAVLVVAACGSGKHAANATAVPLVDVGAGLRGQAGLTATVFATGLGKTSAMAFDPQGRLWVATADYSDQGTDTLSMVTAAGAARVTVLTGLHTPLGLLWHDGLLYVSAKTGVTAYGGFDGTTFTSTRTILEIPAGTGEVNGMVLAPDGRIQLGITSPCDHCVPASKLSAAVISFLPDGTDMQVDASGIRAPIDLTYYPGTSDLFVTMNQRDDLGDATPGDWLAVVAKGQAWGFPACYGQGGSACNGVPSPVATLDTHAAVSGVAIVTGQLGAGVGSSAIVSEWAKGTLQRVALTKIGRTYSGKVSTFVTGLTSPVPVILGPTGAVLVGDWGTGTVYSIT